MIAGGASDINGSPRILSYLMKVALCERPAHPVAPHTLVPVKISGLLRVI